MALQPPRIGLLVVASGILWLAPGGAAQERSTSAADAPRAAEQPRTLPPVVINNGRLTVAVQGRPLPWLLDEISRQTGVTFIDNDAIAGSKVSGRASDAPVDDTLRQILENFDAFFFYGVTDQPRARLQIVWIYPKGRGQGFVPVGPEKWSSTRELEERLRASDPLDRAASLEAIIERKGAMAIDEILYGLTDIDEQVRSRTLYAAFVAGVDLPPDALSRALSDESPSVRFLALDAFANRPDARTMVERALQDSSSHVQTKAQEMLKHLDAEAKRQKAQPRVVAAKAEPAEATVRPLFGASPIGGRMFSVPAHAITPPLATDAHPSTADTKAPRGPSEPPPEITADGLEQLVENGSPRALPAILRGLNDPDERVRTRALFAALSGGVDLPAAALIQALTDTSPNMRFLALDGLTGHPDARTFATRALDDSNSNVRLEAKQILIRLDAAARPPRRNPPVPRRR